MANRLRLLGDHSREHAGCAAAWEALNTQAAASGWEVVDSDNYDALVVNGEGTMHHGNSGWRKKMETLRDALDKGKDAYLLNTVWQDNPNDYDDILRGLSGVCVREKLSALDLKEKHDISARVCPDFSYFVFRRDFDKPTKLTAVTDHWIGNAWGLLPTSGEFLDIIAMTWREFIESVAQYRLLITGRHHGVYAACVARRPFIAVPGNSHKIEGLVLSAKANVPVLQSAADLKHLPMYLGYDYRPVWDWLDSFKPEDGFPHPKENWNAAS